MQELQKVHVREHTRISVAAEVLNLEGYALGPSGWVSSGLGKLQAARSYPKVTDLRLQDWTGCQLVGRQMWECQILRQEASSRQLQFPSKLSAFHRSSRGLRKTRTPHTMSANSDRRLRRWCELSLGCCGLTCTESATSLAYL